MDIASVNEALKDVRAAMRADGGDVEVVKVEGDKIFVKLVGACAGCMMRQMTLKGGVEKVLKQKFPQLKEVVAV